jgi:hypothetical protein
MVGVSLMKRAPGIQLVLRVTILILLLAAAWSLAQVAGSEHLDLPPVSVATLRVPDRPAAAGCVLAWRELVFQRSLLFLAPSMPILPE